MKIKVIDEDFKITLHLPLALIKSRWLIRLLMKKVKVDNRLGISEGDVAKIMRSCYKTLKANKGLSLADIVSASGEVVKIVI